MPRSSIRRTRWLSTVAALLAFVAQLVLVAAPLAEGREGRSVGPHWDAAGTTAHHAHSEESCVACQARTLHAATTPVAPPPLPRRIRPATPAIRADRLPPGEAAPHTLSRAPPVLS